MQCHRELLVHRRLDRLDDTLALLLREPCLEHVATVVVDVPGQLAQIMSGVLLLHGFVALDCSKLADASFHVPGFAADSRRSSALAARYTSRPAFLPENAMPASNLLLEHTGAIARITINRPDKLNALNRATIDELRQAFDGLIADAGIRAIVLHGAGEKAFVAGADIGEIRAQSPTEAERFSGAGQRLMRTIEQSPKPVIAAIQGYALGGGFELALACHLRLASAKARVGLPEIKLGLLPGFGGTQRLPRLIGRGPALSMMLSGETIDAEHAERLGLVERVEPGRDVVEAAMARAGTLAEAAPLAVRAILETVDRGLDMPLDAALAHESSRFGLLCASDDAQEGTSAFLDKRAANFQGR